MDKMSHSEAGRLGAIKTKELLLARYLENPSICKCCLEKLSYKQRHNKFCGHSCSASFNNIGISRNSIGNTNNFKLSDNLKARVEKAQICVGCKIEIKNKKIRKYCSLSCQRAHEWQLRKLSIVESGQENSTRCVKRYLLEVNGHKCSICQGSMWQDRPMPLILDHIDGNSENNYLINLRLVCGNCDMQLPTYKAKNRGNGRHYRRIRYKMNKSY